MDSVKSLFILGDSISLHYRPFLADMTKGVFDFALNEKEMALAETDLDNPLGLNGGDSSRVLEKLLAYRQTGLLDCDVLLLNCGLHDMKRDKQTGAYQVPIEQYRQNLGQIASLIGTLPGKAFWVRITPVQEERHNARAKFNRFAQDVDDYNAAADAVMGEAGVEIIDLYRFTLNLGEDTYLDHVHYQEPVRALQAAFIAGRIC